MLFFQIFLYIFGVDLKHLITLQLWNTNLMCWQDHRRSSIVVPSSFTDLVHWLSWLSISTLHLVSLSFLHKTIVESFCLVWTNLQQLIQTPVPKFSNVLLKCYKWRWWYYQRQNHVNLALRWKILKKDTEKNWK